MNKILFFAFLLLLLYSCEKDSEDDNQVPSDFISSGSNTGEYYPTDGWRSCNPEEVGMDAGLLSQVDYEILDLKNLHLDVHCALIVKNGYIVAEKYYSTYTQESLHSIYSCTKSITSAVAGIAMEEGYINSLDDKMVEFFSEHEIENLTEDKENITLEQMLTMSTGLDWYELEYPYSDPNNTFYQWVLSDDQVQFVLNQPMGVIPGEEYNYNSGISHLLSAIIQKTTGKRIDLYTNEKIFVPLGIIDFVWNQDSQGIPYGGHSMKLTPRDMAKFGYLFLKQGKWEDNQIVPEDWVDISTDAHIQRKYIPDFHYGYHWWVKENEYFAAVGAYGQWIYVVPEHDLVVVFTNYFINDEDHQITTPERLLNTFIIPAVN